MVVVLGFELGSGALDIVFSAGARVDGSFVNDGLLMASTVERAVSFISVITCGNFGWCVRPAVGTDLYEMARSITFKKAFNPFLSKFATDAKNICTTSSLLIPADKTTNLYKISTQDYEKLLHDNITANYRKASDNATKQINTEGKGLACSLNLDSRIEKIAKKFAFITLKDHKPNFYNNPKCRLTNPAKSEVGVIGKSFLEKINTSVREGSSLTQWRDSSAVVNWFQELSHKMPHS